MNALPLATRGYISPAPTIVGKTLDKGPQIVNVKDLKPVIRAAKVQGS